MKDFSHENEQRAILASVETDDTSLALAWITTEGGGCVAGAEIVRASDGLIRSFDGGTGMWCVLDDTDARRRLSEFLCAVGDATLETADEKLREGELPKEEHRRVVALRRNLRSQTRLNAVWQNALVHMDAVSVDEFDMDPELLGTPSGVVDLTTGEIRTPSVDDRVTQLTAVSPAPPGASAPRWQKFVAQVFDGNPEMMDFVQRMIGSALVGNVSPQKFAVLYGPGANGKSVLRDVIGRLLGSYSFTPSAKVFMQSRADRHATEIASLEGKRLVLASEVPAGRSWNDTLLKDLTGGEKMTANRMHKDEFSFTPCGTVIFTANTLPSFPGAQEAMLRRILLVPMLQQFTADEQDPNLAANLIAEEGPEILRWAIDGARKFLADGGGVKGLRIPQSVTDATRVYFEEEDIVLQFLMEAQRNVQDRDEWAPGAFLSNKALLEKFNHWADCNGYKAKWSVHSLTKTIRENARRYGLSERRGNKARGFQVERRLMDRPTWVGEDGAARRAATQYLQVVDNQAAAGDGKGDGKAAKRAKSD